MYGVLIDNPYNDRIGRMVRDAEYMTAPTLTNMSPARLVGGACCRCIGGAMSGAGAISGGAEVRSNPEANVYRPRGAVYVSSVPTQKYVVPYSVVNYPQYNAVELAEVDMLKSNVHPPMSAGSYYEDDMEGGKISKKTRRDFKKIGKVLKPVGRALGKAGKRVVSELGQEALDKATEMAIESGKSYIQGSPSMEGGKVSKKVRRDLKKIGKVLKPVGKALGKAGKKVVSELGEALLEKGTEMAIESGKSYLEGGANYSILPIEPNMPMKRRGRPPKKVAGVGVYEGAGAKSGGASGAKSGGATDKRKARGALISKLMKEKGISLAQASKHIKDNKLM